MSLSILQVFKIEDPNQGTFNTTLSGAPPNPLTPGSILCVFASHDSSVAGATITVSDATNGGYTAVAGTDDNDASNNARIQAFRFINNASSGTPTITMTLSTSNSSKFMVGFEIGGAGTTVAALEAGSSQHQAAPGTGSGAVSSGNFTVNNANNVVVGISLDLGGANTDSVGPGFTSDGTFITFGGALSVPLCRAEHRIGATTGTTAGTFTAVANTNHQASAVAFDEAPTAGVARTSDFWRKFGPGRFKFAPKSRTRLVIETPTGGPISAIASITIGGSATISATGAMSATGSIAFGGTVNNTGTRLTISSNGRYFLDRGVTPRFLLGDSAWAYNVQLSMVDAASYLDTRYSQGFDTVLVEWMSHQTVSPLYGPANTDGDFPFLLNDGGTTYNNITQIADFSTPNDTYWSKVRQRIQLAVDRGFILLSFPTVWGFNGVSGWYSNIIAAVNTTAVQQGFAAYLAHGSGGSFTGLADIPNFIIMVGSDFGINNASPPSSTALNRQLAFMQALKSNGFNMPMSFDGQSPSGGSTEPTFEPEITCNPVYTYGGTDPTTTSSESQVRTYEESRKIYQYVPNAVTQSLSGTVVPSALPVFLIETAYAHSAPVPPGDRPEVRKAMNWSWLSGATAGLIFGNELVFAFQGGGQWQANLSGDGFTEDFSRLAVFIRSIAWWKLVPSEQTGIGSRRLVVSSNGTQSGRPTNYAAAAMADDGSVMVVFVPPTGGGSQSVDIDMRGLAGYSRARWFDQTDGSYRNAGIFPNTSASLTFSTPGVNSTGDNDWFLLIEQIIDIPIKVPSPFQLFGPGRLKAPRFQTRKVFDALVLSPISGTGTITVGGSATLTGTGAMAAAITLTATQSGTLVGDGALSSTSTVTLTESGTLAGSGALATTISATFIESGTLLGNGSLASTITATFSTSLSLVGDGALSGASTAIFSLSGLANASGSISSTINALFTESGTLVATGSLLDSISFSFTLSPTLLGDGALISSSSVIFTASGTLIANGALVSTISIVGSLSGTLIGSGALLSTIPINFILLLTTDGSVFLTTSFSTSLSATLTADGALLSSSSISFVETPTLIGLGQLIGSSSLSSTLNALIGGKTSLSSLINSVFSLNGSISDLVGSQHALLTMSTGLTGSLVGNGALQALINFIVSPNFSSGGLISASQGFSMSMSPNLRGRANAKANLIFELDQHGILFGSPDGDPALAEYTSLVRRGIVPTFKATNSSSQDAVVRNPLNPASQLLAIPAGQTVNLVVDDTDTAGMQTALDSLVTQLTPNFTYVLVGSEDQVIDAQGLGSVMVIRKAFTAGTAGSADDVTIYDGSTTKTPYAMRVLDTEIIVLTAIGSTTVTLRDAAAGAGNALSDALSSATTGVKRDAAKTASSALPKGSGLFLRRSDRGVAGEAIITLQRT